MRFLVLLKILLVYYRSSFVFTSSSVSSDIDSLDIYLEIPDSSSELLSSRLETIEQLEQQIRYRLDTTAGIITNNVDVVGDVPIDQQQVRVNNEITVPDEITVPELSSIELVNNLLLANIIAEITTTTGDVDIES